MNPLLKRLADIITDHQQQIIDDWKSKARELPRARYLDEPLLVDHMPDLLKELSTALVAAPNLSLFEISAHSSRKHGESRFALGFDVEQVLAEYNLLRETLQRFAEDHGISITGDVNYTINRVIDKAIAVSLATYVRQKTEEADRQRRENLSFIIHDLKTPLFAIKTSAEIIEENLSPDTRASVVGAMLDLLRRNAQRLNEMVMKIITRETRLLALTGDYPHLQIAKTEIDLWPIAEKYTDNGEIVIGGRKDPEGAVVWVKDTGIGIPEEQIDRIFENGSADPDIPESTGLGLTIVQKIVRVHQATISVQSKPKGGTTFFITFPDKTAA
jgi:signal transduction histidine kinase